MKKLLILTLIAIISISLIACGSSAASDIDTEALVSELQSKELFVSQLSPANDQAMQSIVKVDLSLVESYQYFVSAEYTGEEYGVFVCNSEADAKTLAEHFNARTEELLAVYQDYATEALPRIEKATVSQSGKYVAYVIADNSDEAATILANYF